MATSASEDPQYLSFVNVLEKIALSPIVQDEAWAALKTDLLAGRIPDQASIDKADALADQAHAQVMQAQTNG